MNLKQITLENGIYYDNGQPISDEEMTDILTEAQTIPIEELALIAFLLKNGDISVAEWEERLQEEIKKSYSRNMMLGAGGESNVTVEDLNAMFVFLIGGTILGETVIGQYEVLRDKFIPDLVKLSEDQIRARSQLYINSSRQMFSYMKGRRSGVPILLPAYPGDGSTKCFTNCHCHWEHLFNQFGEWVGSNWNLGVADHCTTCVTRSERWKPYRP